MPQRTALFTGIAAMTLAADQATKAWVVTHIAMGTGAVTVIPGLLALVNRQNSGAAFGTLTTLPYRQLIFAGFTCVAFAVILDIVRRLPPTDRAMAATCGLLFGGAAGNALDRVRQGFVTDFLRVRVDLEPLTGWLNSTLGVTDLPSFNIADTAIVIGMALFVLLFSRLSDDELPSAEST